MSWHPVSSLDGEDVGNMQIRNNTRQHHSHKHLAADHGLEWPKYLQIKKIRELDKKGTRTDEGVSENKAGDDSNVENVEAVASLVAATFAGMTAGSLAAPPLQAAPPQEPAHASPPGTSRSVEQTQGEKELKEKQAKLMAALRQTHRLFDNLRVEGN